MFELLQKAGLLLIILMLAIFIAIFSGSHTNRKTGEEVNNFLNAKSLMDTATETSFFAIMAVGMTVVIISGGIDLSVGSIYALSGMVASVLLKKLDLNPENISQIFAIGLVTCLGIGAICGAFNGLLTVGLNVHPFIITLGTMWIFRGTAFLIYEEQSLSVSDGLMAVVKHNLFFGEFVQPVPLLCMLIVVGVGAVFLTCTVPGRHIFALGGNVEASRYSGIPVKRRLILVYTLSGLTAGIAAFLGISYYGAAASNDGTGYELYVIAAAVIGGASLVGGKGSAVNAMLGALLIILIRQAIRYLHYRPELEYIIVGSSIIVAVFLDQVITRWTQRKLAEQAEIVKAGEAAASR